MKYFPLECIDHLNSQTAEGMEHIPQELADLIADQTGESVQIDEDFPEFLFGMDFFNYKYHGKYEAINEFLLYDQGINSLLLQGISMLDVEQRKTEWRDLFGESYVLSQWCRTKVVYKMDNDFFHEIKNTTNFKISADLLAHLPFNIMYFDLSDVKNIGEFNGAWVDVHQVRPNCFMFVVYMVTDGSINPKTPYALFSYYCGFNFPDADQLIEIDPKEIVYNVTDDYYIRDYMTSNEDGFIIRHSLEKSDDHRGEIVVAIMQVLEFLHADIPDITESPITKNTYRPSQTIKNKFSEVRMWDVGVRYGKAIKIAKGKVEQHLKEAAESDSKSGKKARKPMRPHIRSAHWQRFHVGKGRTQIRVNWIPPTYVCGNTEIPVTIHLVEK